MRASSRAGGGRDAAHTGSGADATKGTPMQPSPVELWGRCRSCIRWFSIQTRHSAGVQWQCPVCGEEPDQLVNRAHPGYPSVAWPSHREQATPSPPECWYG